MLQLAELVENVRGELANEAFFKDLVVSVEEELQFLFVLVRSDEIKCFFKKLRK